MVENNEAGVKEPNSLSAKLTGAVTPDGSRSVTHCAFRRSGLIYHMISAQNHAFELLFFLFCPIICGNLLFLTLKKENPMKIDRLIGILSILLQKDSATSPELARQFEVSTRTIHRDIEALSKAGIPIATKQGANGGISIMENYKLNKTLLTDMELKDILAGLRSLDSVNGTKRYGQLMEKLSVGSSDFMAGNQSILIDLSSWYKETLPPKIELIRDGIDQMRELEFHYFSPKGESFRCIEPYFLIFRWSSWYVWGFCKTRSDFRLFKLNRMENLRLNGMEFAKRNAPMPNFSLEQIFPGAIKVKALFHAECKWRLIDEFGPDCFTEQPDGTLLFQADYTDRDNLTSWLFSFGDRAVLLEPLNIQKEMAKILEHAWRNYQNCSGPAASLTAQDNQTFE